MLISDMCKNFKQSIILVGFMGAGKSTIGRALRHLTGWPLIDLDELIVQQQGVSIPEIFAEQGEAAFRRYETEALRSLSPLSPIILATGGGIVSCPENWQLMRSLGRIIYLRAEWETLRDRLAGSSGRPLATADRGEADIQRLWLQRLPLYQQADCIVDTDGQGVEEVVRDIMAGIKDME